MVYGLVSLPFFCLCYPLLEPQYVILIALLAVIIVHFKSRIIPQEYCIKRYSVCNVRFVLSVIMFSKCFQTTSPRSI
jgi:hypothetical protein